MHKFCAEISSPQRGLAELLEFLLVTTESTLSHHEDSSPCLESICTSQVRHPRARPDSCSDFIDQPLSCRILRSTAWLQAPPGHTGDNVHKGFKIQECHQVLMACLLTNGQAQADLRKLLSAQRNQCWAPDARCSGISLGLHCSHFFPPISFVLLCHSKFQGRLRHLVA